MLFLTAVCHQDFKQAGKMTIKDALGLQGAFARFITQIMGMFGGKKPADIINLINEIPPPEEWVS